MAKVRRLTMHKIAVFLMLLMPLLILSGCDDDVVETIVYVDALPPAIPSGVYSVTHDGYVEIRWQENRDGGLTDGYGVYYYTGDVGGLEEYELMTTVGADRNRIEAHYLDFDVKNGVTYKYAVNAYNEFGESDLSYENIFDTPRPEGFAMLRDFHTSPAGAGYDFSEYEVVDWDHSDADIFFEYDHNLRSFFVFVGGDDYLLVDIQDYGYTNDITDVNWGDPGGGWSEVGWLELAAGHAYIVWTADDHYAAFRVESLDSRSYEIYINWSYQTDQGNPELKPAVPTRPEHAENYGRRER
jgi:hypothetical protein